MKFDSLCRPMSVKALFEPTIWNNYVEPALPDRTAFVLEHQSSSSLGNERVETDGDQRWTARQALDSRINHGLVSFRIVHR